MAKGEPRRVTIKPEITKAFLLINTRPGTAGKEVNRIEGIDEVQFAYVVTGTYDIIAYVQVKNNATLGHLVTDKIQKHGSPENITRTETAVALYDTPY